MGFWFPFISSLILTALIVSNQTIFFKEWIAAVDQLNTFTPSEYMFFLFRIKMKNKSRENAFFVAPLHVLTSDNAAGDSFRIY